MRPPTDPLQPAAPTLPPATDQHWTSSQRSIGTATATCRYAHTTSLESGTYCGTRSRLVLAAITWTRPQRVVTTRSVIDHTITAHRIDDSQAHYPTLFLRSVTLPIDQRSANNHLHRPTDTPPLAHRKTSTLNTTITMSTLTNTFTPMHTLDPDNTTLDHSLDTPGPPILHLEHINLEHPHQHIATLFYTALLPCTIDPHRTCSASTLWFNVGQQQFHIQQREGRSCRTQGAVGLVVGKAQWEGMEGRWAEMQTMDEVKGTQTSVEKRIADSKSAKARLVTEHWNVARAQPNEEKQHHDGGGGVPYYHIVGPWGQLYEVYSATTSTFDEQSMGMAYIEEVLPASSLSDVVEYYRRYFHTPAELLTDTDATTVAAITVGPRQRLFYRSPHPTTSTPATPTPPIPAETSWHYALYLGPFAAIYRQLEADGLVCSWSEGRSDRVNSWEAAVGARQFRAFDMKRGREGGVVWRLEQEIRSGKHRHYDRRLVNVEQKRPKERWAELQLKGIEPPVAC